jgi:hypothetical protein
MRSVQPSNRRGLGLVSAGQARVFSRLLLASLSRAVAAVTDSSRLARPVSIIPELIHNRARFHHRVPVEPLHVTFRREILPHIKHGLSPEYAKLLQKHSERTRGRDPAPPTRTPAPTELTPPAPRCSLTPGDGAAGAGPWPGEARSENTSSHYVPRRESAAAPPSKTRRRCREL